MQTQPVLDAILSTTERANRQIRVGNFQRAVEHRKVARQLTSILYRIMAFNERSLDPESALLEDAAWQVQQVINLWSSVPVDVLAERAADLADLEKCKERILALKNKE